MLYLTTYSSVMRGLTKFISAARVAKDNVTSNSSSISAFLLRAKALLFTYHDSNSERYSTRLMNYGTSCRRMSNASFSANARAEIVSEIRPPRCDHSCKEFRRMHIH